MKFNLNPVAFTMFGIPVMWYGILIAVGMFLGATVASKEIRRRGFSEDRLWDLLMWAIPAAIIGARAYYVIFQWDFYRLHPAEIINIRGGGLAIHGALMAAFLVSYFYCKRKKIPALLMFDIAAPGIILGQAIGRWGNFINQEAHGGPTDLPWGIIIDGQKVHPTFFYESMGNFLICLFLLYFARKKQTKDGQIISLYLICYGVLRFFVEGLRTDSLMLGPIRVAQLVSLLGMFAGIIGFILASKRNKGLTIGDELKKVK